ncbi:hypothetical protein [Arcobacter sp. LA11]|uniref:hypothetical protein n=1 Tax=Arcobacter sp. LA11 TaxID=1898176 RepID=UPI0009336D6B|nr:hypothetical protein [Arcobacter sp. LA11]
MSKSRKVQKKKTLANTISRIVFKGLVGIAVILFAYILYDKTDFSSNTMTLSSPKKSQSTAYTPSQLKWFDSFGGVENVPSKNKKKSSKSSGNTGFKYEGFKK